MSKPTPTSSTNCVVRPPVLTKRDFVKRYAAGEFGNAAPTWDTIFKYLQSGYSQGPVHIRNRVAGGKTWYNLPYDMDTVWETWYGLVNEGVAESSLYISAMAPHEHGTIQGEVQRTEHGLALLCTFATLPMREALAIHSAQLYGLHALMRLRTYLCANSYDWMMYLLDTYEGHVIEFTSFSRFWGTVPRMNTVFWEVRKY